MKKIGVIMIVGMFLVLLLSSGTLAAQGDHRGRGQSWDHGGSRSGSYGGWHSSSGRHGGRHDLHGHNDRRHDYRGHSGSRHDFGHRRAYPYYNYRYGYRYYVPSYTYPAYPYQPIPVPSEPAQYYWYFCRDPEGYYPYVTSCAGEWLAVVPGSPQPGSEGAIQ